MRIVAGLVEGMASARAREHHIVAGAHQRRIVVAKDMGVAAGGLVEDMASGRARERRIAAVMGSVAVRESYRMAAEDSAVVVAVRSQAEEGMQRVLDLDCIVVEEDKVNVLLVAADCSLAAEGILLDLVLLLRCSNRGLPCFFL